MASRPWVTPDDVRSYTDLADVKQRTNEKLKVDISRAEAFIIRYVGHDFSMLDKDGNPVYPECPENVKTAAILLAEYYGHKQGAIGKMKSETYDDWSYTSSENDYLLTSLGLDALLDPYVVARDSGRIIMKMRKL